MDTDGPQPHPDLDPEHAEYIRAMQAEDDRIQPMIDAYRADLDARLREVGLDPDDPSKRSTNLFRRIAEDFRRTCHQPGRNAEDAP